MVLGTQIKLVIFSFIYGAFFAFLIDISYKLLNNPKIIKKILFITVFIVLNILLYFYILLKINNGILHYYSFLCIVLGFTIETMIAEKLK